MFKDDGIHVAMSLYGAAVYAFVLWVDGQHLEWQVPFVARICNTLGPVFSKVENLVLLLMVFEERREVDRIEWRNLLRLFNNVKTFGIEDRLIEQLSRCLQLEDGEIPLEVLPKLQELPVFGYFNTGRPFTSFINSRRAAGRRISESDRC